MPTVSSGQPCRVTSTVFCRSWLNACAVRPRAGRDRLGRRRASRSTALPAHRPAAAQVSAATTSARPAASRPAVRPAATVNRRPRRLPAAIDTIRPAAGRASRDNTFHAPLTRVDTAIACLRCPQLPAMVKVTATPAAPPNGSRLLTALPAQLRTNACRWVSPGREPVRTNV